MRRWPKVAIGDCCEIVSGATPSTTHPAYWGGDIHWATPKDLSELDGAYISETPRKLSRSGLENCAATVLPAGSVLFSSRAPIGHVAINTVPMATNQGFKSLVPQPNRVDAKFLFHWLRTNRSYLESLGNGATFKEVSKATVSRVEVPLPPVEEQRRIADILDCADALRARRRAVLAQLDALTDAIFVEMFGDPATNTRNWPLLTVGDVAEVQGGLQVSSSRKTLPIEVPYLRVANVFRGALDLREIKSMRASESEVRRTRLVENDLLMVEGHGNPEEIGRAAVWDGSIPNCIHQNHLIRARFESTRVDATYACVYLNSPGGRRHLVRSGKTTSGLNTISVSQVRETPLALPPLELQVLFAASLGAVRRIRTVYESAALQSDSLFASLQHRAFRGDL